MEPPSSVHGTEQPSADLDSWPCTQQQSYVCFSLFIYPMGVPFKDGLSQLFLSLELAYGGLSLKAGFLLSSLYHWESQGSRVFYKDSVFYLSQSVTYSVIFLLRLWACVCVCVTIWEGREPWVGGRVCILSHSSHVQLFATLWTVTRQAPLSMRFSGDEYQSGLPCPSPGDLPDPGIRPTSPALAGRFFATSATWEALDGRVSRLYGEHALAIEQRRGLIPITLPKAHFPLLLKLNSRAHCRCHGLASRLPRPCLIISIFTGLSVSLCQ